MKKWLFTIFLVTMLVLAACGGDDNSDNNAANNNDDDGTEENSNNNNNAANNDENDANNNGGSVDATAAEEVFKSNCASCHGNDLSGNGAPGLTTVGNDYSSDEIADIIEDGTDGGMPGDLVSGDDLDLLANWLAEMK